MRVPLYWARGRHIDFDERGERHEAEAWGWSFSSREEAKADADKRARRVSERLRSGNRPDSYEYLDQPLREEIVEQFEPDESESVIITRNRYGALVLNCRSTCFADVDFPLSRPEGGFKGLMGMFFGRFKQSEAAEQQQAVIERLREWFARRPERSGRLYRTAAGLRVIFTDRGYDPVSREVGELLEELGSDELYRRLTFRQESFRARLTPKPWRCGFVPPPCRYPWQTKAEEVSYRDWLRQYERKSGPYGICRLVETFGDGTMPGAIAAVVKLHDNYTCRDEHCDLA